MAYSRLTSGFFLLLFLAYGYLSLGIPLDLWSEDASFNARTFPQLIAIGGAIISALQFILAAPVKPALRQYRWREPLLLIAAMSAYSMVLVPLGFVPATALFLLVAFLVLGERRPLVAGLVSIGIPLLFLGLMTLLDIHLEPGILEWRHD